MSMEHERDGQNTWPDADGCDGHGAVGGGGADASPALKVAKYLQFSASCLKVGRQPPPFRTGKVARPSVVVVVVGCFFM